MRIEFDPTNRDEATAVRAVLDAMYPRTPDAIFERLEAITAERKELAEAGETMPEPTDTVPDLDSTGTPWDARIHSNPPTQNKDGTWRAKRGVTADVVAAVRAEREALEDRDAVLAPEIAEAASDAPKAPTVHTVEIDQNEKGELETRLEPVIAPAPTPPAPPSPTDAPSFLDVMKAITAAQKDGKIDTAKVKEMCAAVGAGDSTMGLNGPDNADKRDAFMALLASEAGE